LSIAKVRTASVAITIPATRGEPASVKAAEAAQPRLPGVAFKNLYPQRVDLRQSFGGQKKAPATLWSEAGHESSKHNVLVCRSDEAGEFRGAPREPHNFAARARIQAHNPAAKSVVIAPVVGSLVTSVSRPVARL
jgi:hypothetical protein